MPAHRRPFHPDKFLSVVEPVAVQNLLEMHGVPTDDAILMCANPDLFQQYFDGLDTLSPQLEAQTDLERINDLSEANLQFVIREYARSHIHYNPDHQPELLALTLYLDHRPAFEAAWNNFALFGTSARLASFRLPSGIVVTEEGWPPWASRSRPISQPRPRGTLIG